MVLIITNLCGCDMAIDATLGIMMNHDMISKSHADPLRILLEAIFELSQAGFVTETAL